MSNASSKSTDSTWRLLWPPKLFSPVWSVVVTFLIFIISQVIAVIYVAEFNHYLHTGISIESLANSTTSQFFYVLISEGLAAASVIFLTKAAGYKLDKIGLGRKPRLNDVWRALLGFAAFYAILIAATALIAVFYPDLNNGSQDVGFNNLNGGQDKAIALFALVILPPIGEEILVRGYLYGGLRSKLRFVPSLLITSLLFGAAHLQSGQDSGVLWSAALVTFILSIVLVYLREKTGALYAGMMIHALNNLIAFGVHFHL